MTTINPFRKIDPALRVWMAIVITLIVALAGVTIGYLGEKSAAHAKTQSALAKSQSELALVAARAACPTWHDASEIPLASTTTKQGLRLFADFRTSYFRLGCATVVINGAALGNLPPADPKLYPYLPVADR